MRKNYLAKVARTAYGTAHARTFTNIPLSEEIFQELKQILEKNGDQNNDPMEPAMVPLFEARYLLTDKLLRENRIDRVLEVASGFSLRGPLMAMRSMSPHFCYVEIDQPAVVTLKRKIFLNIKHLIERTSDGGGFNGWHVNIGNAINRRSLFMAARHFRCLSGMIPIAVVNEGLMVYFTHQEKTFYAENVHYLLKRLGGVWVTPDIMTTDAFNNVRSWKKIKKDWYRRIGKNLDECNFRNLKQAKAFYEELGFSVEVHSLDEVMDELVCPERLHLPRAPIKAMLAKRPMFVMRIR